MSARDVPDLENCESDWICHCCCCPALGTAGEFETEEKLEAHHKTHGTDYNQCLSCYIPPNKECRDCDTIFDNKKLHSEHLEVVYSGCDACRMCFSSIYEADLHELEHHSENIASPLNSPRMSLPTFLEMNVVLALLILLMC